MTAILYEFEKINCVRQQNYIFQFVNSSKLNPTLTPVYHSHDFYELVWLLSGSVTQVINDGEVNSTAGEIIMLRPEDRHRFIAPMENVEIISLSVKKEEFELFASAFDLSLLRHINSESAPLRFHSVATITPDEFRKTAQELTIYDYKFLLSYFLNAYITETVVLKRNSGLPQMLILAIEKMKKTENLKRGIPAFVELSHYSQSHLSRLIRQYYGMSLKQYINDLRLHRAYNDMILTNKSAEEIAEELGFSSFSHFNKIFKARFSITPAALRKSNSVLTI